MSNVIPDARRRRWAVWTAAAGCVGALGYGGLKAIWAVGGTIGVDDPAQLRPPETSDRLWVLENLGTVALAVFAALILLALVLPVGAVGQHPIMRALGWLGTVMVIPGALGLAETLDYVAGSHLFGGTKLGGVSPGTYIFVYLCFLTLGLAFPSTTFLTGRGPARRTRRLPKAETATSGGN